MKIGLVSCLMKDNDIEHQLEQMEFYISKNHDCDLICFGESFLQGFEGLTWEYNEDLKRALEQNNPIIKRIRELARTSKCGISFGFIEKENNILYSSNMVVGMDGQIVDVFRRVSVGWKEAIAGPMYKEGPGFHTFAYMNKVLGVAICGDLWQDHFLDEIEQLNMVALLWPVYVDFAVEQWNQAYESEYADRIKNLPYPVLMINSFVDAPHRANGGCFVFHRNEVISSLPMGKMGILKFELN